ncbi:unnamed protein product, partial [Ectocarpus sp. 8 AP-2014]
SPPTFIFLVRYDSKHTAVQAENRLEGVSTRARIDIRDLNMGGLPSLTAEGDDRPVVAVAKHLCGVATDLALR